MAVTTSRSPKARYRDGGARRSEEASGMEVERRGDGIAGAGLSQPRRREELGAAPKPFAMPKRAVYGAWQRVKANRGAAGIDRESLAAFEQKLAGNLHRIWSRLASGSYFPPPVKEVEIPKATGGVRPLGIPTVGDRVAQTGAKLALEPVAHRRSCCSKQAILRWADREADAVEIARLQRAEAHAQEQEEGRELINEVLKQVPDKMFQAEVRRRGLMNDS